MRKSKTKSLRNGFSLAVRYLGNYKGSVAFLIVFSVILAVVDALIPYIAGRMVDAIIDPSKIEVFGKIIHLAIGLIVVFGVLQLITHFFGWLMDRKSDTLWMRIYTDYLHNGFSHIIALPMSFHKSRKIGDVTDRMQKAAESMASIISRVMVSTAPQFLTILVAIFIIIFVNVTLTTVIIVGVAIYVVVVFKVIPRTTKLQENRSRAFRRAWGDLHDSAHNIQSIKGVVAEEFENKKIFKRFNVDALRAWLQLNFFWQGLGLYQRSIILFTQLFIWTFSFFAILKGSMTVGQLVMFNSYAGMFFGPFVRLTRNWMVLESGFVNISVADKLLKEQTEKYEPHDEVKIKQIDGNIEFKNVDFKYDKGKRVLKEIDFEAKQGQTIALVGESGVGKTTLIDLISAYHFPSKGKILIDGHDIRRVNLKILRSSIAVVSQEVVLFNDTIKKNLKYGNFKATDAQIKKSAEKAHALDFIEKFPKKWKQIVGERGIKLSVGQKQRVAIARAILRDPKILILDEPTSALDAKSEVKIQEALNDLMEGRTTFIIAHRLSTVRRADKILVFEKGRIVESGKHEQLIKKKDGVYRHLYELQIGLHE